TGSKRRAISAAWKDPSPPSPLSPSPPASCKKKRIAATKPAWSTSSRNPSASKRSAPSSTSTKGKFTKSPQNPSRHKHPRHPPSGEMPKQKPLAGNKMIPTGDHIIEHHDPLPNRPRRNSRRRTAAPAALPQCIIGEKLLRRRPLRTKMHRLTLLPANDEFADIPSSGTGKPQQMCNPVVIKRTRPRRGRRHRYKRSICGIEQGCQRRPKQIRDIPHSPIFS